MHKILSKICILLVIVGFLTIQSADKAPAQQLTVPGVIQLLESIENNRLLDSVEKKRALVDLENVVKKLDYIKNEKAWQAALESAKQAVEREQKMRIIVNIGRARAINNKSTMAEFRSLIFDNFLKDVDFDTGILAEELLRVFDEIASNSEEQRGIAKVQEAAKQFKAIYNDPYDERTWKKAISAVKGRYPAMANYLEYLQRFVMKPMPVTVQLPSTIAQQQEIKDMAITSTTIPAYQVLQEQKSASEHTITNDIQRIITINNGVATTQNVKDLPVDDTDSRYIGLIDSPVIVRARAGQDHYKYFNIKENSVVVEGSQYQRDLNQLVAEAKKFFGSLIPQENSIVIFDVDDTVFVPKVPGQTSRPLMPIQDLYNFLKNRGFKIVFLSSRPGATLIKQKNSMAKELADAGYTGYAELVTVEDDKYHRTKWPARAALAKKYTIEGSIGDHWFDSAQSDIAQESGSAYSGKIAVKLPSPRDT